MSITGDAVAVADAGRWAVAQTYSNRERYAVKNLRNQGYEAFCPLEDREVTTRGVSSHRIVPLFPCYVFVMIEPDRQWYSVNSTYGVIRLLTDRSRSTPTPLFVQENLDDRVSQALEKLQEAESSPFQPGTIVRVVEGPFTSFYGKVDEMDRHKKTWVMLSIFGRRTRVFFDRPGQLELAPELEEV